MSDTNPYQFKPANRRWTLVGMLLGAGAGAMPLLFSEPWCSILLSMGGGAGAFGIMIFMGISNSLIFNPDSEPLSHRKMWGIIWAGILLGAILGGFCGTQINFSELREDEMAGLIIGSCTMGFFVGYAIVEAGLRIIDASRKEYLSHFRDFPDHLNNNKTD